jgi:hypothetical protein
MALNTRLYRAFNAIEEGDYNKAQEILSWIITVARQDPDSHIYQALLFQRSGEEDLAWREIETAVWLYPPTNKALLTAAEIAEKQGKLNNAQKIREGVLGLILDPKYAKYSFSFYRQAYNVPTLNIDTSPFLLDVWLTNEIEEAFLDLMQAARNKGDYNLAQAVQELLDRQYSY